MRRNLMSMMLTICFDQTSKVGFNISLIAILERSLVLHMLSQLQEFHSS